MSQYRQESSPVCPEPKVFVGQLPFESSTEDVQSQFSQYGTIRSCQVITGPDGRSKGCAMILFSSWAEAEQAVESENGTTHLGGSKPLVVKFADPPRRGEGPIVGIAPKKLFVGQVSREVGLLGGGGAARQGGLPGGPTLRGHQRATLPASRRARSHASGATSRSVRPPLAARQRGARPGGAQSAPRATRSTAALPSSRRSASPPARSGGASSPRARNRHGAGLCSRGQSGALARLGAPPSPPPNAALPLPQLSRSSNTYLTLTRAHLGPQPLPRTCFPAHRRFAQPGLGRNLTPHAGITPPTLAPWSAHASPLHRTHARARTRGSHTPGGRKCWPEPAPARPPARPRRSPATAPTTCSGRSSRPTATWSRCTCSRRASAAAAASSPTTGARRRARGAPLPSPVRGPRRPCCRAAAMAGPAGALRGTARRVLRGRGGLVAVGAGA